MYTSAANSDQGTCECCRLLRGDTTPKPVKWCSLCKAWLCDACRHSPVERMRAALRRVRGY